MISLDAAFRIRSIGMEGVQVRADLFHRFQTLQNHLSSTYSMVLSGQVLT